jgi:hypothetical protein
VKLVVLSESVHTMGKQIFFILVNEKKTDKSAPILYPSSLDRVSNSVPFLFNICIYINVTLNIFFGLSICKTILNFYNLPCLSFVQELTYKWISVRELRLMMGHKS